MHDSANFSTASAGVNFGDAPIAATVSAERALFDFPHDLTRSSTATHTPVATFQTTRYTLFILVLN
ncbi:hypothetical protein WI77_07245 [Burkholderia ubonensis]|nr:hypothetical protein WI77_07245 [Burkholderia ubonensis]